MTPDALKPYASEEISLLCAAAGWREARAFRPGIARIQCRTRARGAGRFERRVPALRDSATACPTRPDPRLSIVQGVRVIQVHLADKATVSIRALAVR